MLVESADHPSHHRGDERAARHCALRTGELTWSRPFQIAIQRDEELPRQADSVLDLGEPVVEPLRWNVLSRHQVELVAEVEECLPTFLSEPLLPRRGLGNDRLGFVRGVATDANQVAIGLRKQAHAGTREPKLL